MTKEKIAATYNVAMKILLKKGNKVLLLKYFSDGLTDLPGGRIDNNEYDLPIEKIIKREVQEELGKNLKYKLGKPAFQFRRYFKKTGHRIFITVYEAKYISGNIKLSREHNDYEWVDPKKVRATQKSFTGKEEYLAFKNYFKTLV
ncbi:MAG: NUDIX hydrolase [Candidatus Paceibacterota bacterium]